jgi:predicted nucleic acid-binding protein
MGASGAILSRATKIFASDLTLLECDRVLIRAITAESTTKALAEERRTVLNDASKSWTLIGIGQEIVARARQAFPVEPIRSLDAIHIATALVVSKRIPGLTVLSGDNRVRENAVALGLPVLP